MNWFNNCAQNGRKKREMFILFYTHTERTRKTRSFFFSPFHLPHCHWFRAHPKSMETPHVHGQFGEVKSEFSAQIKSSFARRIFLSSEKKSRMKIKNSALFARLSLPKSSKKRRNGNETQKKKKFRSFWAVFFLLLRLNNSFFWELHSLFHRLS